jgi:hypothetical protein
VLPVALASFLDYLDILRWPLLVGVFLVWFFRRYSEHVGRLLDRINSFKAPLGLGEFGFEPNQEIAADDDEAGFDFEDDVIALAEAQVRVEYEEELERRQNEHQAQLDYLFGQIAIKDLSLDYERIYRVIYGSQVSALRSMRATPRGVPRIVLEAHLDQVKQSLTTLPWIQRLTFEDWFGFLQRNGLALVAPDGLYRITSKGTGFLFYIESHAYPVRVF